MLLGIGNLEAHDFFVGECHGRPEVLEAGVNMRNRNCERAAGMITRKPASVSARHSRAGGYPLSPAGGKVG
jgi:hypothetical protein